MKLHATASAGTEDLLADELRALGVQSVRPSKGVVTFHGELRDALAACLRLRTAMRVLLPVGTVEAPDADAMYEGVRALDWTAHLDRRSTFAVEITGRNERLGHTHFTALRVKDGIVDSLREALGTRPNVDPKDPDVSVVGRLTGDRLELSLDLAGTPLFKRGYRVASTAAPLKETLAAAVLLASGYDGNVPLIDPMCGSGTIAIEAAMIAQRRAPGLGRKFGIERWPSFSKDHRALLRELRDEAQREVRRGAPEVFASDRDAASVTATERNVRRSGLPVRVARADARELLPLEPPGFIVTNPPYGERLEGGGRKQLKTFFWQLGQNWRQLDGHRIAVLAAGPDFESAFGMRPVARRRLWNGPIRCTLLKYVLD